MRKQRRILSDDEKEIRRQAGLGFKPAEIHRAMTVDGQARVSLPTIRSIWEEVNPPDESGTWSLKNCDDPEEARLIIPVLRGVREWTDGRIRSISIKEAQMLVRMSWVMPLGAVRSRLGYFMARDHLRRLEAGVEPADIDIEYAYPGDQAAWDRAVANGWANKADDALLQDVMQHMEANDAASE